MDTDALFEQISVSEVWGVGRQLDGRLVEMGIGAIALNQDERNIPF